MAATDRPKLLSWTRGRICFCFCGVALLVCLPSLLFRRHVPKDTAHYYAPMIGAFSEGEYESAYWHLIPPLFVTVGGILARFGQLDEFFAAKLASVLFYVLSVLPVFGILNTLFTKRQVIIGLVLYCSAGHLIRLAGSGGIDTCKMFFFLGACYFLIRFMQDKRWRLACGFGFCNAAMTLSRGEGALIALASFFCLLIIECVQHGQRLPKRTLLALSLFLLPLMPWVAYEYHSIGYPVTDSRQVATLQKLMPAGLHERITTTPAIAKEIPAFQRFLTERAESGPPKRVPTYSWWDDVINECIKGFEPVLIVLAIAGLIPLIRHRTLPRRHLALLGLILLHTWIIIACVGGHWTNSRYVAQAMPLMLGWSAMGVEAGYFFLRRGKWGHHFCFLIALIYFGIALGRASKYALPSTHQEELRAQRDCAAFIKSVGSSHITNEDKRIRSTRRSYNNGKPVKLLADNSRIPLFADTDSLLLRRYGTDFSLSELAKICDFKHINYIVLERGLQRYNPELAPLSQADMPPFKRVFSAGQGQFQHTILAYEPHTKHP